VGWGWKTYNLTYARDNTISSNYIAYWMRLLQDTGATYTLGPQPNSSIHDNFIQHQVLSGVEPRPACEAVDGARCSVEELIALEEKQGATGACAPTGPCNHTNADAANNAHGGGFYPDDGSRYWAIHSNVASDVYHWAYVWNQLDMADMIFRDCFTDSRLFTNAAAANNVTFEGNVFVDRAKGEVWPAAALAIMRGAGARVRVRSYE
jgi:hypothetical protein